MSLTFLQMTVYYISLNEKVVHLTSPWLLSSFVLALLDSLKSNAFMPLSMTFPPYGLLLV